MERRIMKTKTAARRTNKITFATMPRDYAGLCAILTPRRVRDKADYDNTAEVAEVMAGFEEKFTPDQEDYFDTLCTLMEAYDAEHVKLKKVNPLKLLQSLCEEHGISGAELSRILGAGSRRLGALVLGGEREVTAAHARALGAHFHLPAGMFIE
jgi:antitoxin component HigA of HigAB toxin-antitoxin module